MSHPLDQKDPRHPSAYDGMHILNTLTYQRCEEHRDLLEDNTVRMESGTILRSVPDVFVYMGVSQAYVDEYYNDVNLEDSTL